MKVGGSDLGYCTNIHPGESWQEIRGNVERFVPQVKRRVGADASFGVGLRLSGVGAASLCTPTALGQFVAFLREHDLYVFTINGFPYGPFHGTRVKEHVYLPDWRDDERLQYTNRLAEILAALLCASGMEAGSISTVPGAFKPNAASPEAIERIADRFIRHVAHLVDVERETGRRITLALEPEPCCLLETIDETVDFFRDHLFCRGAAARLASIARLDVVHADDALRRHLGVCLDLCHAAVEFEDAAACFRALEDEGIAVAKIQVTAGLRVPDVDDEAVERLQRLADDVYLHQVVERDGDVTRRHVDIGAARAAQNWRRGRCEWRVHFHVPVFMDELDGFSSTQFFVREALALHKQRGRSPHLEVETYTWSVLPAHARELAIDEAIAREIAWVRRELA